jgi:hypothetical protein
MQQLDEQDWIKSMYIKYVNYILSMAIKPHVCDSWNITKQKKNVFSSLKSPPLWYGSGFFIFKNITMHFVPNKLKQTHNF